MRARIQKLWQSLFTSLPQRRRTVRLNVEALEDRCTPTGNASGVLSGMAFVDANANGVFDTGDAPLPGVTVNLTGTTNQAAAVTGSVVTDASGAFTFLNVLPGTYSLGTAPVPGFVGSGAIGSVNAGAGISIVNNVPLVGGQTINQGVGFQGGLAASFVSLRQFLNSTTTADYPYGSGGSGQSLVNYRENNTPTVNTGGIANVDLATNSLKVVDLAGFFSDPDFTNSVVRFQTSNGPLNVELFDTQAPQTVANFFNYVNSNAYDNTIFNRLISGFVLQGGGFSIDTTTATTSLNPIATTAPVPNEFSSTRSNVSGTIAMAKTPDQPDSATSQFFFNLADNGGIAPDGLDFQNGGFTVFGKVVDTIDQLVLNSLGTTTPVVDQSGGATNHPFKNIPLPGYTDATFPGDTTIDNYLVISDVEVVKRDEILTYSAISSNPDVASVVNGTSNNEMLNVVTGVAGQATITVTATDRFGASVQTSFVVTVTAPVT